jgi:hypothetical protein
VVGVCGRCVSAVVVQSPFQSLAARVKSQKMGIIE